MSEIPFPFQPGAALHYAISAGFRAQGTSFDGWCASQGISAATARGATFGQSSGPKGKAMLVRLIEAAGAEVVAAAYQARMRSHLEEINRGAA